MRWIMKKLEAAITEKTKAIIPVDLGGVICDYDKIFEIAEKKKNLFHPNSEIQKKWAGLPLSLTAALTHSVQ